MAFSKEKALERAEKFAAKGQHDKAAREYSSIIEHEPKDVRASLMLADCWVRSGEKTKAVERYAWVANHYSEQREPQKAIAVYRQILNLEPTRIDIQLQVGLLNHVLGRVPDAVAAFEAVAHAYLQSGDIAQAIDCYCKAADADAAAVSKRLRVAELCSREHRVDEAIEHFRLAADRLLGIERFDDFIRVGERLLYHKQDDFPMLRELARVYLRQGEPRRALMKLNALLQLVPADVEGLALLAETFAALERPDKAVSVIGELVRELKKLGDDARDDLVRVLRRGLEFDPNHADLRHELEALGVSVVEPIEEIDSGVEFMDPDEPLLVDADDNFNIEPVEDAPSMSIAVEPSVVTPTPATRQTVPIPQITSEDSEQAQDDSERIVSEAKVYMKYRLYEHAAEHLRPLLDRSPDDVAGLSLRARICTELGQPEDAVATYLRVAELTIVDDPKLARGHLEAALMIDEDNVAAQRLLQRATTPSPEADPERAIAEVEADFIESEDLDELIYDEDAPPSVEDPPSAPLTLTPAEEAEFAIELQGDEPDEEQTQPILIEDRFGLGEPAPVIEPLDDPSNRPIETDAHEEWAVPVVSAGEEASAAFDATFTDEDDEPTGDNALTSASGAVELGTESVPIELDLETPVSSDGGVPVAATPDAATDEPDLSDELAEIRFYLAQGLDEDAQAALGDLRRRHPSHSALAEFDAALSSSSLKQVTEGSAAKPLLDLFEDDQEADDYLSAIFSDEHEPAQTKPREVGIQAQVEGGGAVDAATLFDLGVAYREMGLIDDAIDKFEQAAGDPRWRARALAATGTLRVHQGDVQRAQQDLNAALDVARTQDEISEARYELALVCEKIGDVPAAREHLQHVQPGFRDRDERLRKLD